VRSSHSHPESSTSIQIAARSVGIPYSPVVIFANFFSQATMSQNSFRTEPASENEIYDSITVRPEESASQQTQSTRNANHNEDNHQEKYRPAW
jgi:hypothetical protein